MYTALSHEWKEDKKCVFKKIEHYQACLRNGKSLGRGLLCVKRREEREGETTEELCQSVHDELRQVFESVLRTAF